MLRRHFIKVISFATAYAAAKSLKLGNLANKEQQHVCLVEITFPTQLKLDEFRNNRSAWMNVDSFDNIINQFKQNGLLLKEDRSFQSSKIRIAYHFNNVNSHDKFIEAINSTNTLRGDHMLQTGYQLRYCSYKA